MTPEKCDKFLQLFSFFFFFYFIKCATLLSAYGEYSFTLLFYFHEAYTTVANDALKPNYVMNFLVTNNEIS